MQYLVRLAHIQKRHVYYGALALITFCIFVCFLLSQHAERRYTELLSVVMYDRNAKPIIVEENTKGHYALKIHRLPDDFVSLLLAKEDRFFYYHLGMNPVSTVRALFKYLTSARTGGSSTITEQLAKNLLGTENHRTVMNKLQELAYAVSMELFFAKDTILMMYANTVYLGNQVQGFETASQAYFGKSLAATTQHERIALLTTLSHPTSRNPWGDESEAYARSLFKRLVGTDTYVQPIVEKQFSLQDSSRFELNTMRVACTTSCTTSIDTVLTSELRTILSRVIAQEYDRGVRNGAVVVIDAHSSELLAIVGSPNPTKTEDGGQINMALAPRPIGSTVKPFIYLKGFVEGLRPYTLVDDREYKYPIATGYSLYPKNYDGTYHGEVTLHEALANSLNVPSVKILEYIGLPAFYTFLESTLAFQPIQPLNSYQYGIALGGLEMDLLTLTHYFTLFPRNGLLTPLHVVQNGEIVTPPQSNIVKEIRVADSGYTELVTAILSDRLTGVGQFGLKSSLNLTTEEFAVKTGTSRDFHDSWVVGYTPDFVVGVWLGNSENEPLAQVSGQSGAGAVWHDVMEYLLTSSYASKQVFGESHLQSFDIENSLEWGLKSDKVEEHRALLIENRLITSIHENDYFEYTKNIHIPLRALKTVRWFVNGVEIGEGASITFSPLHAGSYEIEARSPEDSTREILTIHVTEQE